MHKSGFVNIIGNPNVGKSTLMNALVGEKLSIITSKAQTTRHRIMGIVNGDDFQIVYSDTPGILKPAYKLQEKMMKFVGTALSDADILLYVTEAGETQADEKILSILTDTLTPILLVINKTDLINQSRLDELTRHWQSLVPKATIMGVSALNKTNLDGLFDKIIELLPIGPPYYEKTEITDRNMRFFVSEIIREKLLLNYQKEIPYSCEVHIDSYKESPEIDRISAVIYVARDSQKGIIIGHKGERLKKTATEARLDMEAFIGKKVFLEVHLKVLKDWRDSARILDRLGYEG
jgi:GTP-binding protein Era